MNRVFVVVHQGNYYRRYVNAVRCDGVRSDRPLTRGEVELFRIAPKMLEIADDPEAA